MSTCDPLRQHGATARAATRVHYPDTPLLLGDPEQLDEWGAAEPQTWRATWGGTHNDINTPGAVGPAQLSQAQGQAGAAGYIYWTWETGTGARTGIMVDAAGGSIMLPPTRTVHAALVGFEDGSIWHTFGVNNQANGQLEANAALPFVQLMTVWVYAEYDRDGAAGVCDCPSYTDRRRVSAGVSQFFPRPPFARRVSVFGANVAATWTLHTNPFTAGPPLPINLDTSVSGPSDGVLISLTEGLQSIVAVVWGLQI